MELPVLRAIPGNNIDPLWRPTDGTHPERHPVYILVRMP
jgi:hypothetical protein